MKKKRKPWTLITERYEDKEDGDSCIVHATILYHNEEVITIPFPSQETAQLLEKLISDANNFYVLLRTRSPFSRIRKFFRNLKLRIKRRKIKRNIQWYLRQLEKEKEGKCKRQSD